MKSIFLASILLCFFVASCSSGPATPTHESTSPIESPKIKDGLKLMEQEKYEDALKVFDQFLQTNSTHYFAPIALYNSGLALYELKRYEEAVEKYRVLIQRFYTKMSSHQADAFYRIALCYEALGDDAKTVAALKDALSREKYLPEDVRVETIGRLAGVYARIGQYELAQKYYKAVEEDIEYLRKKYQAYKPSWLSRTLYNMGRVSFDHINETNFESLMESFSKTQQWLFYSSQMQEPKWSKKASEELAQNYQKAYELITSIQVKVDRDPIVAEKIKQEKMIKLSIQLYENLAKLKALRGIDFDHENKDIKEMFERISFVESKIEQILKSRPVHEGLTEAAKNREGLKRKGRTIMPGGT